jgi:hypothetical protein
VTGRVWTPRCRSRCLLGLLKAALRGKRSSGRRSVRPPRRALRLLVMDEVVADRSGEIWFCSGECFAPRMCPRRRPVRQAVDAELVGPADRLLVRSDHLHVRSDHLSVQRVDGRAIAATVGQLEHDAGALAVCEPCDGSLLRTRSYPAWSSLTEVRIPGYPKLASLGGYIGARRDQPPQAAADLRARARRASPSAARTDGLDSRDRSTRA